jgi:hypothetical protein
MQLWHDELTSGNYQQATGALRHTNSDGTLGHCCLDVACYAYITAGHELTERPGEEFDLAPWGPMESLMPDEVRDWLELDDDEVLDFTYLNDRDRMSFDEIAGYVQHRYLGYV